MTNQTRTHAQTDMPQNSLRVVAADDLLDNAGSIVYHNSLQQLMQNMHLSVSVCPHKDSHKKQECKALGPFQVKIKSIGTAAVMEWVNMIILLILFFFNFTI